MGRTAEKKELGNKNKNIRMRMRFLLLLIYYVHNIVRHSDLIVFSWNGKWIYGISWKLFVVDGKMLKVMWINAFLLMLVMDILKFSIEYQKRDDMGVPRVGSGDFKLLFQVDCTNFFQGFVRFIIN